MMTDFRFALRQLLKSPGFTLLALITLALGIGLNTAIFSLIKDLFLRGLLFREANRLVTVYVGTEKFWRTRMNSDPNVLGRSIRLDGVAHTIVGVIPNLPANWFGPQGNEVWTTKPFIIPGFSHERMMRGTAFLRVIGRMKPGQTMQQVRAALPALDQSYKTQYPGKIDAEFPFIIKDL